MMRGASAGGEAIENVRIDPFSSWYRGDRSVRSHVCPASKVNGASTSKVNGSFRLIATIAEPSSSQLWSHDVGLIDAAFIGSRLPEWSEAICYLAGPPAFVKAMRAALEAIGADPDNLRIEEFDGY